MKGAYILLIKLEKDADISIGAIGTLHFSAGNYCYVGSAKGPGGIEARVKRHLRDEKKLRWHIDYLLQYAKAEEAFIKEGGSEIEIASHLSERFESIPGFGASDSPLSSHLFICGKGEIRDFLNSYRFRPFP